MAASRTGEIGGSPSVAPNAPGQGENTLWERLSTWAFTPLDNDRFTSLPRLCLRILLIMYQEYFRTHLTIRASALTFSIVLSLVPMLALSTSILKGLGNTEQLKQAVVRFIEQWEPPQPASQEAVKTEGDGFGQAPVVNPESKDAGASPPQTYTALLHRAINLVFAYVDRTNFAALGIFGVLGLIVVVLLVLSSIEDAMNAIWHTRKGRAFFRRIMDYLALLLLLPISLNVALAAEAILANQQIMEHIAAIIPAAWIAAFFIKLIPFVFIVITLMTMYLFFPNIKVQTQAALAGALFASTFWFIFQKIYIALQVGVANYNAIYGSFASVPLFLVWLQIGWTFILLGALLAFAIQHHQHYRASENGLTPQRSLQMALDILQLVYSDFDERRPTLLAQLDQRLPTAQHKDIAGVVELLAAARLLQVNDITDEGTLLPVTSAQALRASEVVNAVFGDEPGESMGNQLALQAIQAASSTLDRSFHQFTHPFPSPDHGTTNTSEHPHPAGQQ